MFDLRTAFGRVRQTQLELKKMSDQAQERVLQCVTADTRELERRIRQRLHQTRFGQRLLRLSVNAHRPGLKPRRRKYWQRRLARHRGTHFLCYEYPGVSIGNPRAISQITVN